MQLLVKSSAEDDPRIVWRLIATTTQDDDDKNVYMI
jgi:hypothetical protein